MNPTLVVLAAGMGSRYGGIKQLESVGPDGATLMDYSVHDAMRAGFVRLVFVIRREIEEVFRERIGRRYETRLPVSYAFQEITDLPPPFRAPPERTKPWGTGHAVLVASAHVREPFAVINADDFYGASAMRSLGNFLRNEGDPATCALVGYTLRGTLSEHGTVSRGLCEVDAEGWLNSIVERTRIERLGRGARCPGDGGYLELSGDEIVSMNLWGFRPGMFALIRERFLAFLAIAGGSQQSEFYIPSAINDLMRDGRVHVRVLPGGDQWCGVTYREDHAQAAAAIRRLIDEGVYPESLWT